MDTPQPTPSYLLVLIYREQLHQNGFSMNLEHFPSIWILKPSYWLSVIIYYLLRPRNAVEEGNSWLEHPCQAYPSKPQILPKKHLLCAPGIPFFQPCCRSLLWFEQNEAELELFTVLPQGTRDVCTHLAQLGWSEHGKSNTEATDLPKCWNNRGEQPQEMEGAFFYILIPSIMQSWV